MQNSTPRSNRRTYTIEQYRADLTALDNLRHRDTPALRRLLDEQLTQGADLAPPVSGFVVRRPTIVGGFVAATAAAVAAPVTTAVLRAVGLTPRPRNARGALRCHWVAVLLAMAAAVLGAPGCNPQSADGAPSFAEFPETAPDLVVWTADAELTAWVQTVAPRLEAATGLVAVVTDDPAAGVPMFWSTRGSDAGWLGFMHDGPGQADWIAIDSVVSLELRETVVLHEILHALGAGHVDTGAGVLSPQVWTAFPLTAADLEGVCNARSCTAFVREG